ncbi:MAG: FKBP-type peptidyl-prolyl cis-trans isomerase [Rhodoferax sp.]
MKIDKDTVVTMQFKVYDAQGRLLDDPKEAASYLHGGYGNTFDKVEAALQGQERGYQASVALSAAEAFGERDESLVQTMPRSEFPPGVKVGGLLKGRAEDGEERHFTVVKIKGAEVHLDGNHPWAGKDLRFVLKVTAVRAATADEIAHRHAHGEHGHHHH